MIIDTTSQRVMITDEDRVEIGEIPYEIVRLVVDEMIYDAQEDLTRGVINGLVTPDTRIDAEGEFEMLYEMFETCYYECIKHYVVKILERTVVQ